LLALAPLFADQFMRPVPVTALGRMLVGKGDTTNMRKVIYRIVDRGPGRFIIEAYSDDHGAWRSIAEFPTFEEAHTRKAKLEQILRASQEEFARSSARWR